METEKVVSLILNGVAVVSVPLCFFILVMAGGGPDIPAWYGKRTLQLSVVHALLVLVSLIAAWKLRGAGDYRMAWISSLLPLVSLLLAGILLFKTGQASEQIKLVQRAAHLQEPTTFVNSDGYEISKSRWRDKDLPENTHWIVGQVERKVGNADEFLASNMTLGKLVGESELVLEIDNKNSIFPPIKNAAEAKAFFKSFRNQHNQGFWDVFTLSNQSKFN